MLLRAGYRVYQRQQMRTGYASVEVQGILDREKLTRLFTDVIVQKLLLVDFQRGEFGEKIGVKV